MILNANLGYLQYAIKVLVPTLAEYLTRRNQYICKVSLYLAT
jgi:hypothetical protein